MTEHQEPSAALTPVTVSEGDVLLRLASPEDIPSMTRACQDPEMQRWTTIPVPYDVQHAQSFVARMVPLGPGWCLGRNPGWVISRVAEPRAYDGFLDLRLDERASAEIGYSVAPWARGRGVATTAVRLACRYAFEDAGLARVYWYASVGNDASRRVAEKVGFRILPGVLRQMLPTREGGRADAWVGDLLPTDLK
ncbi:MAG: GNAT family N-acetyltransferase [Candidatus Nanopelagicales bacterium]